ncbi:pimeloyl-ACP methyl ester carboxylesterase [Pseudomonas citronellolis]|uniref:alpha/beta fold hydrolase n=1 Tax=Pseudomonas citronellolis TaxID=53408 RepID=UPI00209D3B5C|nr:alpha/beta hydrolase [Pseudomonas citronellolis]MCP1642306.1 pimeloyl-ACP methyl ester carboxylesterase [Pseudomonas citronellolis]MCP1668231.1 pimeloyl-ACP methyl ester carboxylesterase [Pseudomonas citronellolis]MCP1699533.1 pimeloyl-ACP methyl ester carboxylesterase [Pseudomonas citronellolis]MCP1706208.1 pimeloyl-ACP methyl ester carboxylesterase [Pseudomonas citronellolis]MCP1799171.1 pimeloyl-ACP methyl ester carboxylesterase [Pseudomonas citronellolis]
MAGIAIPLRDWRAQGRTFDFNGYAIRYWEAGEGEPLLLIHGFPSASWDWNKLWQPLAERYRVIACDMLGFGDSAKPRNHAYRILEQADLQQALLEHLAVREPVHLLVHDYGNSVGQELLARHLEGRIQLASLVFLNGGLFPETHRPVLSQKLLLSPLGGFFGRFFDRGKLAANFAKVFGPRTRPSEEELDAFWSLIACNDGPKVMHRLIHYILDRREHRERWVGAMQRTSVPLRLIDGPVDPISGAHMVERYRQLIPRPDTVMLDGIGHYPQTEAPEQVLAHYLAFRARLAGQVQPAA